MTRSGDVYTKASKLLQVLNRRVTRPRSSPVVSLNLLSPRQPQGLCVLWTVSLPEALTPRQRLTDVAKTAGWSVREPALGRRTLKFQGGALSGILGQLEECVSLPTFS